MIGHHDNACSSTRRQRGFSLVELMVAMALSLILLAGVLAIFASSRKTYETTDRLSRIQESGRFALDTIVRDLRSAGYLGCSRRADLWNMLGVAEGAAAGTLFWNFAQPVQGFDAQNSNEWEPDLNVASAQAGVPNALSLDGAGDALVIRGPRNEFEPVRATDWMNDTVDPITVTAAPALLEAGDIVMVSDCQARSVFQVTANIAGEITHAQVNPAYDAMNGNRPGNWTADLNAVFTDAAELVPMQSTVYYIANAANPEAGTSLWRRLGDAGQAEELVEGVEAMQVQYGEEVGTAAAPALEYRQADEVVDWTRVATVRIALLVRSLSEYGTDVGPDTYDVLGVPIPNPGDRHMRQVFTTTVTLRNRAV